MLRFIATDIADCDIVMPPALSVVIRMDEDVPADDMLVVFPYQATKELKRITAFDGSRVVFIGIIDEEQHITSSRGEYLRISARSPAAYLLDNESEPVSYDHPGARFIYDRHVKGYGIRSADDDDATLLGELIVTKGMSQWGVIKSFCTACYSSVPRVSSDGVLYMKGPAHGEEIRFTDCGIGYPYISCTENRKRCEEISAVNVKANLTDSYSLSVSNDDAISRGICRERYLNAALTRTPISSADTMISSAGAKAYSVTLEVPVRLTDVLGCPASVHRRSGCDIKGVYVGALRYRMTSGGESTKIVLKRRNS